MFVVRVRPSYLSVSRLLVFNYFSQYLPACSTPSISEHKLENGKHYTFPL